MGGGAGYRQRALLDVEYTSTAAGIVGALLIAVNLNVVAWGYVFFLVSSLGWFLVACSKREPALAILNIVFMAVNLLGLYRWLG